MKNRAELAEAVCEAAEDYCSVLYDIHNDDANELEKVRIQLRTSINAWRNAPPDPPELKITPGPMILSPSDKLSDEEVWLRALEAATRGQWNGATKIADHALDAFREKFRKESK
jgi:hypothetical protein